MQLKLYAVMKNNSSINIMVNFFLQPLIWEEREKGKKKVDLRMEITKLRNIRKINLKEFTLRNNAFMTDLAI
jgi:hypothetical protein